MNMDAEDIATTLTLAGGCGGGIIGGMEASLGVYLMSVDFPNPVNITLGSTLCILSIPMLYVLFHTMDILCNYVDDLVSDCKQAEIKYQTQYKRSIQNF